MQHSPKPTLVKKISSELVALGHLPEELREQFERDFQRDVERAVVRYSAGLANAVVHQIYLSRLAA